MGGIGVQPCCCGSRFHPCARCDNEKGPLYFDVVLNGILERSPEDCSVCTRYNNITFTLMPYDGPGECGHPFDNHPCCWGCFVNTNWFGCGQISIIELKIWAQLSGGIPTGTYYLTVDLNQGAIRFQKTFSSLPDCRSFASESIPFVHSGMDAHCTANGASTCLVTAVNSVSNPCCRDICYPNETPSAVTVAVANIQDVGCGSCNALNATYVVQRQNEWDEDLNCFVARFEERCGFDSLAVRFIQYGPIARFFHSSDPDGHTTERLNFGSVLFPAPYAACNQYDGATLRSYAEISDICRAGNGDPYDAEDPATYATATLDFS